MVSPAARASLAATLLFAGSVFYLRLIRQQEAV